MLGKLYKQNSLLRTVLIAVGEVEMKTGFLKPFFIGFACGMGVTLLSLFVHQPGSGVSPIDKIGEKRRIRRAKEEEKKVDRELLRAAGFSDAEIEEAF